MSVSVSGQTYDPAPTGPATIRRSWLGRAWAGLLTALLLMLVGLYGLVYLIVVVLGLIYMFMWFLRFWGWTCTNTRQTNAAASSGVRERS